MHCELLSVAGQQSKAMWHELAEAEKDEESELKKIFDSFGSLVDKAQGRDGLEASSRSVVQ